MERVVWLGGSAVVTTRLKKAQRASLQSVFEAGAAPLAVLGTLQLSTGLGRRPQTRTARTVELIVVRRERRLLRGRERAATRITATSVAVQRSAARTHRRVTASGRLGRVRSTHRSEESL